MTASLREIAQCGGFKTAF